MGVRNKKNTRKLLFLLLFLLSGFLFLQLWAKNFVEDFLIQKMPFQYTVSYSDLSINILSGNIILHKPSFKFKNKDTLQNHTNLKLESLQINGIGYWDLFFNKTLSIKNILLKNPKLNYYPHIPNNSKKTKTKTIKQKLKTIHVKEFNITNGAINIMKQNADTIKLSVSSYNLTILGGIVNLQSLDQKPIIYNSYQLKAQHIILENSAYEVFKLDQINTIKGTWHLENLQIISKYDKKELSTHLSKERDHINLNIPKIILEKPAFNFNKNRFGIKIESAKLVDPNLEIYRDKLLPDDLSVKPLYSKSLRNLNFDLEIENIEIKNGYISYAELIEPNNKAGKLYFNNVDGNLNHVSNLKDTKKTEIEIRSKLMGKAPLELNWSFDVNNTTDSFEVSGSVNSLSSEILNPFFKPNLNAVTQGTLQQMYFTFYGNSIASKGDMKMRYEDFKFKILRENSFKVNNVLTILGNIFIANGSKTDEKGYRYGDINAERNVTKSFFNYLWINVKSGIVSTLIGSGEK